MSVTSYIFFGFLALFVFIYYIVPKKVQWTVLLLASLVFYAWSGLDNLIIVVLTSIIVYFISGKMQKNLDEQEKMVEGLDRKAARGVKASMKEKRKKILVCGLVVVIGILGFLKYYNFAIDNINVALGWFNISKIRGLKLIVPLGISFYTFMMISYMMDLYNGKISAQKNFFKYLAYAIYFPHVTQGPIARYDEVSPQIYAQRKFDYDTVIKGLWLMLWGFFKKMVIADRLAEFVNIVFGPEYMNYKGLIFVFTGILYSFQIYCDFSGCMDIVRGASELFGIRLTENFERPYFSQTLPEFWRRWHISLGSFFREYVFFPVSTSKLFLNVNTKARNTFGNEWGRNLSSCIPILSVWLLTGLWHGDRGTFLMWGLFHGILISLSTIFEQPMDTLATKLKINRECDSFKLFCMLRTFFLCVIGRIIFMGQNVSASFYMLKSSIVDCTKLYNVFKIGLVKREWLVVFAGLMVLLVVSIVQEYRKQHEIPETIRDWLAKQNIWFRWGVLLVGLTVVIVLGKYGLGVGTSFIYEKF